MGDRNGVSAPLYTLVLSQMTLRVIAAQPSVDYEDNQRSQDIPSEFRGPRRKDDYFSFIGTNQVVPGSPASTSTRSSNFNQLYEVPSSRSGNIRSSKGLSRSPAGSIQHGKPSQKSVRFDLDSASSSFSKPAHRTGTRRRLISRRIRVAVPELYDRIPSTLAHSSRVEYNTSVQPIILEAQPNTDYLYCYENEPLVNYIEQPPQYIAQSDQLFYAHPQSFYPPAAMLPHPGQCNHGESLTKADSSTKSSFGSIAGDFGTIEKFFSSLTLASVFGPLFEKMQMLKTDVIASYGRKIGQFDFLTSFTSHQEREHEIGMKLVARMYAAACRGDAKGLNSIMRQLHELGFLVGANLSDCTPSNDGNNTWNHMVNLMTLRAADLMGGKPHPKTGSHMLLGSEDVKFDPSHAQMQGAKIAQHVAMPSPVPWQDLD